MSMEKNLDPYGVPGSHAYSPHGGKRKAPHYGCDHVFFIGFLGAGKSTVARNLGKMFNRRYVDTDRAIVRRCGMTVSQYFDEYGETEFRIAETKFLKTMRNERSCLISCGGGIIETPENSIIMREMGRVVYLDLDLDDALGHIRNIAHRPDLGNRAHASNLLDRRRPLYEEAADIVIDIRGVSFDDMTYKVAARLLEEGLL